MMMIICMVMVMMIILKQAVVDKAMGLQLYDHDHDTNDDDHIILIMIIITLKPKIQKLLLLIMMMMIMLTLNPMMPKMMMAAKIEVAQFVNATMQASLHDDHDRHHLIIMIIKIHVAQFVNDDHDDIDWIMMNSQAVPHLSNNRLIYNLLLLNLTIICLLRLYLKVFDKFLHLIQLLVTGLYEL